MKRRGWRWFSRRRGSAEKEVVRDSYGQRYGSRTDSRMPEQKKDGGMAASVFLENGAESLRK